MRKSQNASCSARQMQKKLGDEEKEISCLFQYHKEEEKTICKIFWYFIQFYSCTNVQMRPNNRNNWIHFICIHLHSILLSAMPFSICIWDDNVFYFIFRMFRNKKKTSNQPCIWRFYIFVDDELKSLWWQQIAVGWLLDACIGYELWIELNCPKYT